MIKSLNWGLLGTARINRSIIPPLRLSVRNNLLAVASRTQEKADAYAKEWSIPRAHGSYEALLADPDIDVIYIPLPNQFHAEWAIKAAEAGKHVLCEKPLALSVADVDAMTSAAEKAGTFLVEAFMYRFHQRTLKIKEMIEAGEIGDVHHVKGAFTFPLNRPKDVRWDPDLGGGSLWDVGCYPLSFSRYVIGSEPEEVFAYQHVGDSGIDESFSAQLLFANGVTAQFDSGFRSQFRMHTEVTGSKASLFIPMTFKPEQRCYIHIQRGNNTEYVAVDGSHLYVDEVEHVADAVLDGVPSLLPLSDSRNNIKTILALYESARTRNVVKLM